MLQHVFKFAARGADAVFIVLAIALMAASQWRTPLALKAFDWLFMVVCLEGCWIGYKRGYLTKRVGEIHQDMKASSPTISPLLLVAFYLGVIAMVVIKFT
jgi:hypothetical protein